MRIIETKDGAIVKILVKPNSKEFTLTVEYEDLIVHSTEEPKKGKVNKEILKELSRLFHKKVKIVSGATSREKHLLIEGAAKMEVEKLLKAIPAEKL